MKSEKTFELILLALFFVFSWWLMDKSFGYDAAQHQFRIARHQIGDFGLHLSLARSFSWGDNYPPELPFFPGRPIPYHYMFDLVVGLLEKIGLRIDVAFNGLSALSFTALLYFIYKLPQIIFRKSRLLGVLSVLLFLFHSGLTFVDFLKGKSLSFALFGDVWGLPDYIHKGPFDGSLISIFFTLNVFLNQRHLIAALAISLGIVYFLLFAIKKQKQIPVTVLVSIGLLLGMMSRLHSMIFIGNGIAIGLLLVLLRRVRWLLAIYIPIIAVSLPHFLQIASLRKLQNFYELINPGFLVPRPLAVPEILRYWWLNLGIALPLLPLGVLLAKIKERNIFYCFLPLFVIANIFQLSYRIDHNHTLINYFLIVGNFFISYILWLLWQKRLGMKLLAFFLLLVLTVSGVIDLMAVKNDFQYTFPDAPANRFMAWVKESTDKRAVFLAREDILDPITLSGRYNYFGATYYPQVMGYPIQERRESMIKFFEANDKVTIEQMKSEGIDYIALPVVPPSGFWYRVDREFFEDNLKTVYSDEDVVVYKL
ncbi:MAG: hypothetical protein UU42_C0010G0009 [Candidatus Woesebacteria bacterium GW2011_GWA1_41_13b]|uniref:Glycosyltransferase RgtA/B/C/D-like domain-containing protein n=1 Tax=Candidatus Woesebacteria bacterium GW2011_GWA1_41_13b TaxID=1618555 RepID=A0A0G0URW3_9BACT|nr:MAG: hypothetical protein UU42_C0010G0009 [Candidatus Woesebacteria bacterium GW2011_GWA1_41_13b]